MFTLEFLHRTLSFRPAQALHQLSNTQFSPFSRLSACKLRLQQQVLRFFPDFLCIFKELVQAVFDNQRQHYGLRIVTARHLLSRFLQELASLATLTLLSIVLTSQSPPYSHSMQAIGLRCLFAFDLTIALCSFHNRLRAWCAAAALRLPFRLTALL